MKTHAMIAGIIFLALGLITVFFPSIFESFHELNTSNLASKNIVQSLVGGTEIAIGLALLNFERLDFDLSTVVGFVALILLLIALLRFGTTFWYGRLHIIALVECAIEFCSSIFLLWLRKAEKVVDET